MKSLIKAAVLATVLLTATQVNAQNVKADAKKVGHKTSELAAKGASGIVDKKYRDKVGPGGQTIYINKHSHYYYISKHGHRIYLKRSELRDR